jgi:hypothetical protein
MSVYDLIIPSSFVHVPPYAHAYHPTFGGEQWGQNTFRAAVVDVEVYEKVVKQHVAGNKIGKYHIGGHTLTGIIIILFGWAAVSFANVLTPIAAICI